MAMWAEYLMLASPAAFPWFYLVCLNLPYTFNAFHISKPSKTLGAGHFDTADAVEIHDVPRDQQPLLHDRLLLLHADLGDHTDPPLPSNISLWGGLVQGQFCTQV